MTTTFEYDDKTFRLTHLLTKRNNGTESLQDLRYTYDPVGNITQIQDNADIQNTIYFRNQRVEPSADYKYDAIYRLVEATGREHLGQTGGQLNPPSQVDWDDSSRTNLLHPGDGKAMGNYTERYNYDDVGNIREMQHSASSGSWSQVYEYKPDPANPDVPISNRLVYTRPAGGHDSGRTNYPYDAYGNMTGMPHIGAMDWDFKNQLHATQQQLVNNGGTGERTYYAYDSAGQRVRKVTERQAATGEMPTRMKERVYLGGLEMYREYNGGGITATLERETLHAMDDKKRIALLETKTVDRGAEIQSPKSLTRYQLDNHIGSACLELDNNGAVISCKGRRIPPRFIWGEGGPCRLFRKSGTSVTIRGMDAQHTKHVTYKLAYHFVWCPSTGRRFWWASWQRSLSRKSIGSVKQGTGRLAR